MDNPHLAMRLALHMTQEQLAAKANLGATYIRRCEQGTVSNPNHAITRVFFQHAPAHVLSYTVESFLNPNTRYSTANYPAHPQPTQLDLELAVEKRFKDWVKQQRQQVTPEQVANPGSLSGLCRLLCIHPYTVQYYLRATRACRKELALTATPGTPLVGKCFGPLPHEVAVALSECGGADGIGLDAGVFYEALEVLLGGKE